MCYLLHPERAEDIHVVTRPTNEPGRVGVVVKKELDSTSRSCNPKDLCFCGSPDRATRIDSLFSHWIFSMNTSLPPDLLRGLSEVAALAAIWGLYC